MKVLFVGGGTLGHIYPSFPVIDMIKKNGGEVYFIAGKKENEKIVLEQNTNIDYTYYIDVVGFKRKITFYNFVVIRKYLLAKRYCLKLLKELKPDVVIGMGGYVSGPVLKAAIKLKIKTIIHEQNFVYGLVNKVLKDKVNNVLLTYDMDIKNKNRLLVGNPRCSEFYKKYYGFTKGKSFRKNRILVIGGSLGASKINDYFIENYLKFKEKNIEVVLITGKKYYSENQKQIDKLKYPYRIIPFVNNVYDYMIDAKLVVSRSGSTTISEILGLKKVAILIPSPNVSNNHQHKNAKYYQEKNCCEMVLESEIDDKLLLVIDKLLNDENARKKIEDSINECVIFDSDDKFYKAVVSLYGENNG